MPLLIFVEASAVLNLVRSRIGARATRGTELSLVLVNMKLKASCAEEPSLRTVAEAQVIADVEE